MEVTSRPPPPAFWFPMPNRPSPEHVPTPHGRFRLFSPILAGATLRERLIACLGAMICIGLTGLASAVLIRLTSLPGHGPLLPLIVAPMGASAVLLFAVPASPLAQPWSIIGGNTISAMVGVAVAYFLRDPMLAIGVAVALAIAAMSFARCLHPPGGAAALTAVLIGPAATASGLLFPFVPVALNSLLLVALGWIFHKASGRVYPHRPAALPVNTHQTRDVPPQIRAGFRAEDIEAALAAMHETFDIDRDDLDRLLRQVELEALVRSRAELRCEDIMSRDVVKAGIDESAEKARSLLLSHNIRTLPIEDANGKLVGAIGLRELAQAGRRIADLMSTAATAAPGDPAMRLVPVLTNGQAHAVVIVDEDLRIEGLITQTDLLSALASTLPGKAEASA